MVALLLHVGGGERIAFTAATGSTKKTCSGSASRVNNKKTRETKYDAGAENQRLTTKLR